MGKLTTHFTKVQQLFLTTLLKENYIRDTFYLTGGTALAACYLNHRLSEDIDLFSVQKLDEPRVVEAFSTLIGPIAKTIEYARIHDRLAYTIEFPKKQKLKVDVVHYPYKQIESPSQTHQRLPVDSFADIGVNKLLTISQRTQSKDFVDLFYILKKYTVWDLRHGVEHKFKMDIEPFYLSSLFYKVEELTTLPRMKKKLTLEELKHFFLSEAKKLARTMVKP